MGGRRRNRQPDALAQGHSEDSSDSGEKPKTNEKSCRREKVCSHVKKAFEKLKYMQGFNKTVSKTECEECTKNGLKKALVEEEKPASSPFFICVRCGLQACDNESKSHMTEHFKSMGDHFVAVNNMKTNIWCYRCDIKYPNTASRKILHDVEILKKLGFLPPPVSQQPISLPYIKKEVENENIDKLNSPANGLTKVVGLANLGNTCFFNAVLQCLSQTPFLVKVLEDLLMASEKLPSPSVKCKNLNNSEENEQPSNKFTKNRAAFTSTLCETLKTMQSMKTRSTHVPNELLASFRKKTMQCMDGGQHDSHDLLRHLLDIVRNEDPRVSKNNSTKDDDSNKDKAEVENKSNEKSEEKTDNTCLLGSEPIFRGVLISTLKCLECKNSSKRTEPFLDLSLPVVAMTEKHQSPIVNKKNRSPYVPPDSASNSVGSASSFSFRNQFLKKNEEKKPSQESKKSLRLRMREKENNASKSNANKISEEKQPNTLESETDADVEDNVSVPEIVESGYSSEKVSALTSPVSPDDQDLSKNSISNDLSASSMNGNLPQSPVDGFQEFMSGFSLDLDGPSPVDDSPMFAHMLPEVSDPNCLESPMTEATNELGEEAGISPSTSLIVNSELSPEGATMSSLSSPVTSKDSPTSPPSSVIDEKTELEKNPSTSATDTKSPGWDLFEFTVDENLPMEMDQIRSLLENPFRKMALTDQETPEYQTNNNDEDELMTTSPVEQPEVKSENGLNDVEVESPETTIPPSLQRHGYDIRDDDCSVQSCLNQFTALELITGSNKVYCEHCTAKENKGKEGSKKMVCTKNTKQYLISQVPAVLILHLKRFQSLTMGFRKVAKHVRFPFILDLSPMCTDTKKPKIYSLYGIVEHGGSLHSGHYIAYVKTRPQLTEDDPRWAFLATKDCPDSPDDSNPSSMDSETEKTLANCNIQPPVGQWYFVSDSRVKEVDEATVLQSQAYILFYERIL